MNKLLIFVDWFLPGFKAGGQIQSCANLVYALKGTMEIYIVTSDRDLGDDQAYPGIQADQWHRTETNLYVNYLSPANQRYKTVQSIIRSVNPQCVYLNSMFSLSYTLLPVEACIRQGQAHPKIVLAPRGMLHKGALQYKKIKKKVFFQAFKLRGFHKKITFHATNTDEQNDIRTIFGNKVQIHFAPDFPSLQPKTLELTHKAAGSLKCVFVARIASNKNLLFFLSVLKEVTAQVTLSIVGPVENEAYWAECQRSIRLMPANITITYLGTIPNEQLAGVYRQHHLLVLTTEGENFGHVIFEALSYGRPVLISDRTPWKNLEEKGIGWELPLSDMELFREKTMEAAGWDQYRFDTICSQSWNFASAYIKDSGLTTQYLQLFS